jgi:hypothetical protein
VWNAASVVLVVPLLVVGAGRERPG